MLTQNVEETIAIPDPDESNSIEPSDRKLLMRFSCHRQEDAFLQLVDRHAAMVMGVCRRILRDHHEAEDAFQATFLILAQQAHKTHWSNSVAAWLCKVAYRTAMKAAKKRLRRRYNPQMVDDIESPDAEQWAEISDREEKTVLYEELGELPERFRAPLVLCYLEGMKRGEAAAALNCSDAAVQDRLARGKQMLRMRLARRGVVMSVAFTFTAMSTTASQAASLSSLVVLTTETCAATVLHGSTDIFSTRIGSLTQQGVHAMRMTTLSKISLAVGLLLMAGINWTAYSKAAGPATLEGDVSTAIVIELDDGIEDDTEDWALEFIVWQTPDDDPEQVGVTELEGLWVVESFVREGVDEPRVVGKHWQFVGGTFSIRFGATILSSGDVDVAGDFSMDISAMPTQIDINSSTHTNMVEVEGIYELDDDLLTICFYPTQGEMRRARPDRFESTDEIRTWLWKMRRVTEED